METVATSVRITAAANALLSDLARKSGKPKAQIAEEALRDWEDRMLWTEVQHAGTPCRESTLGVYRPRRLGERDRK